MSIVLKIKELAEDRMMTITELERKLDFGQGTIRRWDKSTPSADKLDKVATYFDVSVDYLLGRESYEDMKLNQARADFADIDATFFRIDTDGLSEDEIAEVREKLAFAQQLALEDMRRRKKGGS